MFTGIIEEVGVIKNIIWGSKSIKITLECNKIAEDVKIGDSIAVNGICLTIVEFGKNFVTADVMPETMDRTNFGKLNILSKVNMERALRLTDRLGGHIVSGHIDGTGTIVEKTKNDNAEVFTIKTSENIIRYIIEKGSVAIDGTSLTVANVKDLFFSVSLIPHTYQFTIFENKNIGDMVNIECDIFGKYIERFFYLKNSNIEERKDISLEFLKKHGFM